ncbi:uncharacterized protein K02A2.6-like [Ornithodoros turicata]|uniref:uncharacterized protein K02A2.6-like n=1 Tax=Ornithodoros turicata TaxID=34597 RepID=UPI0031396186
MRLLEFDFTISHVPGKDIHTADVLSRKPVSDPSTHAVCNLGDAIPVYELLVLELLPASSAMLSQIKEETTKDPVTSRVVQYCHADSIRSDNGPQFASAEFRAFLKDWGISHKTSSPYYAQSNGAAERTVQTTKQLLKKSSDIQQALMIHRATPGKEGYSSAELLMGRRLKTNLPTTNRASEPYWNDNDFRAKNQLYKGSTAAHYNMRHRVHEYEPLQPGTTLKIS